MVSSPRKTAVKMVEPQFSLLTCLFAAGCILFLETLIDLDAYDFGGHRSKLFLFVITTNVHLLNFFRISRMYGYAMEDWIPVLACCLFFGYRLGWRGVTYSLCGLLIFLVVIHNFRGIGMRQDVFEDADDIRRWHSEGQAQNITFSPWTLDTAYFVAALIGSIFGAALRTASRKPGLPAWSISTRAVVWVGWACVLLGMIEAVLTILYVQPRDIYLNLPITHGYALTAFGVIMIIGVQYKERLSRFFNFEIV